MGKGDFPLTELLHQPSLSSTQPDSATLTSDSSFEPTVDFWDD